MKLSKIISLFCSLGILTACVNPGPGAYEPDQMRLDSNNEQIKKNVEGKLKQRSTSSYPKLSEMPERSTPKYNRASLLKFQEDLSAMGRELQLSLHNDLQQVGSDRDLPVQIMEPYRRETFSLEDAATRLQKRILYNRARLKSSMTMPRPELGGLPPKNMRDPQ